MRNTSGTRSSLAQSIWSTAAISVEGNLQRLLCHRIGLLLLQHCEKLIWMRTRKKSVLGIPRRWRGSVQSAPSKISDLLNREARRRRTRAKLGSESKYKVVRDTCGYCCATDCTCICYSFRAYPARLGTVYCGSGDYRETCHADLGISFVLCLASLLMLASGDDSLAALALHSFRSCPSLTYSFPRLSPRFAIFLPRFSILHKLMTWLQFVVW